MANEAFSCASYEPGHNVHFIQARVKAHMPRFWAKVDLIGPKAVRVVTQKQDQVLFHHSAIELYMWTIDAYEGEAKYAPASKFLSAIASIPVRQARELANSKLVRGRNGSMSKFRRYLRTIGFV
jgi:hypothetical protein